MTRRQLRSASFAAFALISLGAYGCTEGPGSTITITPGSSGGPITAGSGAGGSDAATTTTGVTTTTTTTGAGAGTTTSTGASTSTTTTTGVTTTTTTTGTGGPPPGSFELALVDSSPSSDLMDDATLDLTITPSNGFTGTVNLSATLPTGVTADFDDATPTITGGAITAHVTLHVESGATVGDAPVSFEAMSAGIDKTADGTLTVNPSLTIHLPLGIMNNGQTPANPYMLAYGPYPIVVNVSDPSTIVTVKFMNDDSLPHIIHSDAGPAFPHDGGGMAPHSMDPLVRDVPQGVYQWYLHGETNGAATPGELVIHVN